MISLVDAPAGVRMEMNEQAIAPAGSNRKNSWHWPVTPGPKQGGPTLASAGYMPAMGLSPDLLIDYQRARELF